MSVAICVGLMSCALPKSQTRDAELTMGCTYNTVDNDATFAMCMEANDYNKYRNQVECDGRWEQIRSTQ